MFIDDIIKIKYVDEGYLPNWPYHLISDEELCNAFLSYGSYDYRTDEEISDGIVLTDDEIWNRFLECQDDVCFFKDNYPIRYLNHCSQTVVLYDELAYRKLVTEIRYHIDRYLQDLTNTYELPDWVYSYMIGSTLGINSNVLDLHYLLVMLDVDNDFDEFTPDAASACYECSKKWISKLVGQDHRPPTMFGEPHVIKSLRLDELSSN